VSFAAITLCVASQRVIPKVSVYFIIDSGRKLFGYTLVLDKRTLRQWKYFGHFKDKFVIKETIGEEFVTLPFLQMFQARELWNSYALIIMQFSEQFLIIVYTLR
jgi:hypothetical protein